MGRKNFFVGALCVLGLIVALNLVRVNSAAMAATDGERDVSAYAYYRNGIEPNAIVFDLRGVTATGRPVDVMRVLFRFAEELKDREFEEVVLAWRGEPRFVLQGRYFSKLGSEYEYQNPIYAIRTLPEHLYTPDGKPAFGTWTGGWLGVMSEQMKDVNEFHRRWYIDDL